MEGIILEGLGAARTVRTALPVENITKAKSPLRKGLIMKSVTRHPKSRQEGTRVKHVWFHQGGGVPKRERLVAHGGEASHIIEHRGGRLPVYLTKAMLRTQDRH